MDSPGTSASPQRGPVRRSRAGSNASDSYHLVEVGSKNGRSNQGSPDLTMKPAPDHAGGPWSLDWHKGKPRERWAEQMDREESPATSVAKGGGDATEGFDPQYFLGEWLDNLGHKIVVSSVSERLGCNQRPGAPPRLAFTANLQKVGVPDKRFRISLDKWQQWRCGNGTLVPEESSQEFLTWEAEDGRVSNWERPVPEGPVYFDAPPDWNDQEWGPMPDVGYGQWVAIDVTEMNQAWNFNPQATEFNPNASEFVPSAVPEPRSVPRRAYASPKGTPVVSPAIVPGWGRTPTPSPMVRPVAAPMLQGLPDLSDADFALPAAIELQLVEEGSDAARHALVSGSRFDWTVSEPWRELCTFPKDSCVMSPTFSIQDGHMQLSFYPNGSREAEPGHCSVALSRGPDCPGIKFEFLINGRSTGPKVCLGRRYLGDYIKPFEDEGNTSHVVVSMNVLEIIQGR